MEKVLESEIEALKELAADPTLESCCRRDLEDQLKVARAKAQLTPQDRSQARQRIAARVLGGFATETNENEESDPEELEALRVLRLQELEREARSRTMLQSEGHGTVTSVAPNKLLKLIENSAAQYIVCHFVIEGDEKGQHIDQRLENLANRFVGTRFVRCPVAPTSTFPQRFGLPPGPGLVCCLQGAITGTCSLIDLDCNDEEDAEDAVESWLKRRKFLVLLENTAAVGTVGAFGDGSEDESEDEDEWRKPCKDCGRSYPHQHIRSVYRAAVEGEGEGSDDEDSDG